MGRSCLNQVGLASSLSRAPTVSLSSRRPHPFPLPRDSASWASMGVMEGVGIRPEITVNSDPLLQQDQEVGIPAPVAVAGISVPEGGEPEHKGGDRRIWSPWRHSPKGRGGRFPPWQVRGKPWALSGGDTGQIPSTAGVDLGSSLRVAG